MFISDLSYLETTTEASSIVGGGKKYYFKNNNIQVSKVDVYQKAEANAINFGYNKGGVTAIAKNESYVNVEQKIYD